MSHLSPVRVCLRVVGVVVVVAGVCEAGVPGHVAAGDVDAALPRAVAALHRDAAPAGDLVQIEQRAHAADPTVRAFENFEIHFACWFRLRGSWAYSILIGSSVGSARDTEDIDRIKILSLITATLRRFGRQRI